MTRKVLKIAANFSQIRKLILETLLAWYKCRNSQNAQKCFRESAKGVFGPPEWESQKGLLHGAKLCFGVFRPVRNRVCTVRETFFGLPLRRPENTFSTLPKALLGILAVSTLVPGQQGL